jgi:hypothetical protein
MVGSTRFQNVVAAHAVIVILSRTRDNRSCLSSSIDSLDVDFTLRVNEMEEFKWEGRDGVMLVRDKFESVVELDGTNQSSIMM